MNKFDQWVLGRQLLGAHVNGDSLQVSPAYRDLVQHLDAVPTKKRPDRLTGFLLAKGVNPQAMLEALAGITPDTPRPDPEPEAEASAGFDFEVLSVAELDAAQIRHEWLVEGVLVAGQPCVVGGPRKALKTSVMIALGLALATGRDFLGQFRVATPRRVLFLSGESGQSTVQETVRRVASNQDIDLAEVGNDFQIGFRLPALGHEAQLQALARQIEHSQADVVIIDPLYLCLLGSGVEASAANLYEMGPLLAGVARACLEAGATPILVHHLRKNRDNEQAPPELEDLAFAGVQEFARQWLLLGRRTPYEPGTGHHELWLTYGGSAGHSGAWALTVDEGVVDEEFRGRFWSTALTSASEARQDAKERRRVESEQVKTEAKLAKVQNDAIRVADALRTSGPATKNTIRDRLLLSGQAVNAALEHALRESWVEQVDITIRKGRGQTLALGFRYVDQSRPSERRTEPHTRTNPDKPGLIPGQDGRTESGQYPDRTTPPPLGGVVRSPCMDGPIGANPDPYPDRARDSVRVTAWEGE